MTYTYLPSPLGELLVVRDTLSGRPAGLTGLYLPTGKHATAIRGEWQRDDTAFDDVRGQLDEYFAGERRGFDVPLDPIGNGFQRRVWAALLAIPYGDQKLRRDSHHDRLADRCAGRGAGERTKSNLDHRAVSPGGRCERFAHRLRRRTGRQALAPVARAQPRGPVRLMPSRPNPG